MAEKEDIIFGRNPVSDAIKSGKKIDKILLLSSIRGPFEKEVRQLCKEHGIPLQYVPNHKLDKFTKKNHQGIIAFASLVTFQSLDDVIPHVYEQGETPLFLILEGITDVRNVGAIARSAEVFGAHAIIMGEKNSARINHDAVKSSAGAILNIPLVRERSLVKTVEYLQNSGFQVFATDLQTDYHIADVDYKGPIAIVMGSEGEGVSKKILQVSDERIKIPQVGTTDSLNVSVATGVILYEILKQRQSK